MDWRDDRYDGQELSIEEWKKVLRELRESLGKCRVSFIGGEPFVRRGFVDLLEYCHQEGIEHDTTTNGTLLNEELAARVVATQPLFLNVSVDGASPAVHDRSRGMANSLKRVEAGLAALTRERIKQDVNFPVRIKVVVHAWNFHELPAMLPWLDRVGADSVDFEPVRVWAPEVKGQGMWISEDLLEQLNDVLDQLIRARRNGAKIETSEHRLRNMIGHFAGRNPPPEVATCRVGLRRFEICPNGDVRTCTAGPFGVIGNVRKASPREIWSSDAGKKNRSETTSCERGCAYSCLSKMSLRSMVSRGKRIVQSAAKRSKQETRPSQRLDV
jgi:MoaA/NifB/PqqE/SkfB family radical SAM enzyme